jgi:two-component system sensor histidine kinase KdpD
VRSETDLLRQALIDSVSHELRTPLASILGAATVLRSAPAVAGDPRLQELANVVREEAERLNNDIQNLLDATRISSEGIHARLEWTEPADIVNSAIARCQRRLEQHRITLDIPENLPLIQVDSILVQQALVQVLDNAGKYSPPRSTIAVVLNATEDTIRIAVSDTGAGLVGDEQLRLWDRFFRGARNASAVGGSGLGLWIARAFVKANSGSLSAFSEGAGRGTVITIELPAVPHSVLNRNNAPEDSDG